MHNGGVGVSVVKPDAWSKVTGKALFAADMVRPGMLVGKVLRSTVPHALIDRIDTGEASRLPGVVKILTAADIPGPNGVGIVIKDEPVLCKDKIRRVGDALALVAAETEAAAEQALKLIKVYSREIPAVFDAVAAMDEAAPQVHDRNILHLRKIRKGDVEAGFAAADVIVENRYTTQRMEHAYIEPEAGLAEYDGSMLTIWVSTQNTHFDRREVARTLNLSVNRVRIIQAVTGGGFGGKLDISVQCYLGLLAYHTGRPVKMVYSREESIISSVKRHPYIIDYKSGADKDGRLTAVKAVIIGDTGAYASYGPAVLIRAAVHCTGPYEVPNVYADAYAVYTNNPTAGAMRGFGVPQMAFAHESQMDQLAEKLGLSPVVIRLKNCLQPGATTATGQVLQHSIGIMATIRQAAGRAQKYGNIFGQGGEKR
ncbi:xanthine dehydrogenase family protein molybdopterin-binding subunit [Sporomusa sphaeroides]|uniref:xanthine dehydrogenase family protein molybdopterin-binding subunit n=1 Tax=Sporomusa sphaeroides TaxID=47679 RepID=UPI003DA180CF